MNYFFIEQKFCKHHSLWKRKQQDDETRQLTIQAIIYYLIYSDVRKHFVKSCKAKKFDFPCSIEIIISRNFHLFTVNCVRLRFETINVIVFSNTLKCQIS